MSNPSHGGMGEIDKQELARYLAGEASSEEGARVLAWLDRHPTMRARLEGSEPVPDDLASIRSGEAFLASISDGEPRPPSDRAIDGATRTLDRSPAASDVSRRTRTTRTALVIFVVAVMALVGRDLFFTDEVPTQYATGAGEYTEFTLPDGTDVQLNVASRMEIPVEFGAGGRVVRLQGEAYFDVSFDPTHSFVVETDRMEVEVRGTSFDVSVYADDPVATVVVSDGAVTVRTERDDAILAHGQRAALHEETLRVDSVDVDYALAWREGRLAFRATPLADVARRMERWYGIQIVLRDEGLDSMRIDGTFESESAADAARSIAAALNVGVEIDSRRIVFRAAEE